MTKISNALAAAPIIFLLIFYFYPLAAILQTSFASGGGFAALFTDAYYARVVLFTIFQATLSALLTLIVALPAAYVFARHAFRGANVLRALTTIPFLMPTIVVATAFTALLGPRGSINLALMQILRLDTPPIQIVNTLWIILLAHTFYNFTIVLRIVGGFWSHLDPQIENAARVLGANGWRTFRDVTLPLIAPAIAAAALLIFIFDFTSFGVILILGGPRLATLEVEIYRQTVNLFNLPLSAALSLLQLGCTFALMIVYTRLQVRLTQPLRWRPPNILRRKLQTTREKIFAGGYLAAMLIFLLTPLVSVIAASFESGVDYYAELFVNRRGSITFVPPIEAVRNSLFFAGVTIVLAVGLGLAAAYALNDRGRKTEDEGRRTKDGRRRILVGHPSFAALLDPIFMLPLGTSAVTLGFGFIIAFGRWSTSIWLVPMAHTLVAFPFVVRSLLPILRSIQPRLREAAQMLGATPARVWREIDLPIILRAIIVGAVFAFTVSMGEFGATALVARPDMPTIPVAIYRFLGQPGAINFGQALALSTILMVVSAVAIVAMERLRVGESEF